MSNFFKSLSTISILAFITAVLVIIAFCGNLLSQIAIFTFIMVMIYFIDKSKMKASIMLAIFIGIPIFIINPLVNQNGSTILFSIVDVPLAGRIDITLEALIYALLLTFKLMNTILIFCVFNILVHPDRLLNLFSFFAGKSALIITITTRLIPFLSNQLKEIADIQKTRGVVLDSGNGFKRVKTWYPFSKIILFSSLENSAGIAEALQSKGYGIGKRTVYYNEKMRIRDWIVIVLSIGVIVMQCIISVKCKR